MKKLTLVSFLILLLGISPILLFASGENNQDPPKTITLTTMKKGNTPHRSLITPIDCYYQSGVLYFSTWEDLGEAEIIVEDTETGFYSEDSLNGIDVTTINIAGASGTVLIYVNTADASYYGELEL